MSRPLVSVCMPCFNAERYLPAALDSVLAQTYRPLEIVCVNDRSTDGTAEILAAYQRKCDIIVIDSNCGNAAASRNLALDRCRGEFVKFFDSDDLLSPGIVEAQVTSLLGTTGSIAISGWTRFTDSDLDPVDTPAEDADSPSGFEWLLEWIKGGGRHSMMQCGMFLIPRDHLQRVGGWDVQLTLIDDLEFFGRVLSQIPRVIPTSGKLYYRSGLPGSLSGRKSRKAYESAALAVNKFTDTLTSVENSPRVRRVCADLLQAYYFEIAPQQPDLGEQLRSRAVELGGSDLQPSGGPVFQTLRRLIGWRAASRLRSLGQARGYAALRQRLAGLRNASRTQSHSSAEGAAG